jgi:tetratricopeptide (TPR) repeat protein
MGYISYIYAFQGKYEQALEYFEKFEELRNLPDNYGLGEMTRKAYILIKLNRMKEAEVILKKEIDHCLERIKLGRAYNTGAEISLASSYALLGEKEKAYNILHRLEEYAFPGGLVRSIQVDPLFASLWGDEEFHQIIDRQEKKYLDIKAEIARLESGVPQP